MPTQNAAQPAQLFHSPSSYYSMIARLALTKSGRSFSLAKVDIHRRMAQLAPSYVRINPHMTVPALVLPGRTMADSRDILTWAYRDQRFEPPVEDAVARQYRFAIDELTFSCLLRSNALARRIVPGKLARTRDGLIALAAVNPDLADLYRQRAEVFAERVRTFDPHAVTRSIRRALGPGGRRACVAGIRTHRRPPLPVRRRLWPGGRRLDGASRADALRPPRRRSRASAGAAPLRGGHAGAPELRGG